MSGTIVCRRGSEFIPCALCGNGTPPPAQLPEAADLIGYSVLCGTCGPKLAKDKSLRDWMGRQEARRGAQIPVVRP